VTGRARIREFLEELEAIPHPNEEQECHREAIWTTQGRRCKIEGLTREYPPKQVHTGEMTRTNKGLPLKTRPR